MLYHSTDRGVLDHWQSAVGSAVQMETKSFFQTVLCGFGYDEVTTLEGIIEGFIRNFIPLDICFLIVGDDIAVGSIDFFKSITRADQHIFEICLAVRADDGIFIYGETRRAKCRTGGTSCLPPSRLRQPW